MLGEGAATPGNESSTGNVSIDSSSSNTNVFIFLVTLFIALIFGRFIAQRLWSVTGISGRHRHTLLLLGLCGSGKTTLFAQLVANKRISARTSMQPNRAAMAERLAEGSGVDDSSAYSPSVAAANSNIVVVDFPGHRRLRESLAPALENARDVVFVVDAVTIQDDRHEGAQALAELVVSVVTSPEFYGVQRVLVACTKRDELTSYSAKAVRKLLEAEITRCVATRRGGVQSIDSIVNSAGVAVGRKAHKAGGSNGGYAHELFLGESGKFSFDAFPVPVQFADVSSLAEPGQHPFNVNPVRDFAEGDL
ncbi:signal recognition particle receptor subunit beta [Trypanosoma grayi]|uniref:signal recognition particle receptor subunit beta n=1 Tax=Trypanosoma grayi TaxID=71804 RepID=UPI0004F4453D|nr:signal recognition particle receptor subunit beta [Trypanosoma grayi]KEG07584.1 signal recognition particle receptor subunit beta [Trypanosoma grayi]